MSSCTVRNFAAKYPEMFKKWTENPSEVLLVKDNKTGGWLTVPDSFGLLMYPAPVAKHKNRLSEVPLELLTFKLKEPPRVRNWTFDEVRTAVRLGYVFEKKDGSSTGYRLFITSDQDGVAVVWITESPDGNLGYAKITPSELRENYVCFIGDSEPTPRPCGVVVYDDEVPSENVVITSLSPFGEEEE